MKYSLFFCILALLLTGLFIMTSTTMMVGQFSAGLAKSDISPDKGDEMLAVLA